MLETNRENRYRKSHLNSLSLLQLKLLEMSASKVRCHRSKSFVPAPSPSPTSYAGDERFCNLKKIPGRRKCSSWRHDNQTDDTQYVCSKHNPNQHSNNQHDLSIPTLSIPVVNVRTFNSTTPENQHSDLLYPAYQ